MIFEEGATSRKSAKVSTFLVSLERFRANVQSRVESVPGREQRAGTYKKTHRSGFFVDDDVTFGEDAG
jgi:hypothetical protein